MSTLEKPGSLNDFLTDNPDTSQKDYFDLLRGYRVSLARDLGVDTATLHEVGGKLLNGPQTSQRILPETDIDRPSSLNEFMSCNSEASVNDYFKLLDEYRRHVAEQSGISLEELHSMGHVTVRSMSQDTPENLEGAA